jgi:hypothetical protein
MGRTGAQMVSLAEGGVEMGRETSTWTWWKPNSMSKCPQIPISELIAEILFANYFKLFSNHFRLVSARTQAETK